MGICKAKISGVLLPKGKAFQARGRHTWRCPDRAPGRPASELKPRRQGHQLFSRGPLLHQDTWFERWENSPTPLSSCTHTSGNSIYRICQLPFLFTQAIPGCPQATEWSGIGVPPPTPQHPAPSVCTAFTPIRTGHFVNIHESKMSTSVKEGISLDETISAVTPVPLEKGDTAKMSPTKHVHIQAAAPLPRKTGPSETGHCRQQRGCGNRQRTEQLCISVTVMHQLPLDGVTGLGGFLEP